MEIEIWSDVVCPWCFIGKRRLESALERFEHRDAVHVHWRAFELDPTAPARREGDYVTRLAEKYGTDRPQAQQMVDTMTETAAREGLDFRFDLAEPGNTFDAHRLLHLAGERGCQDAVKERLLLATFTQGEPIGDRDTLVRLAAEAGLDAQEARDVLVAGTYADQVRAEEALAQQFGASGVPFFVVDRRYGVAGAQPAGVLLEVLDKAWADSHPAPLITVGAGPTAPGCEGESCAV